MTNIRRTEMEKSPFILKITGYLSNYSFIKRHGFLHAFFCSSNSFRIKRFSWKIWLLLRFSLDFSPKDVSGPSRKFFHLGICGDDKGLKAGLWMCSRAPRHVHIFSGAFSWQHIFDMLCNLSSPGTEVICHSLENVTELRFLERGNKNRLRRNFVMKLYVKK